LKSEYDQLLSNVAYFGFNYNLRPSNAVAAMRGHLQIEHVQRSACVALNNMCMANAENATRAGNEGAVEAVVGRCSLTPGTPWLLQLIPRLHSSVETKM